MAFAQTVEFLRCIGPDCARFPRWQATIIIQPPDLFPGAHTELELPAFACDACKDAVSSQNLITDIHIQQIRAAFVEFCGAEPGGQFKVEFKLRSN